MKKFFLIVLAVFLVSSISVYADYSYTINWYYNNSSVNNVRAMNYICNDNGCYTLGNKISDENSNSNNITVVYPMPLPTYGYATYWFSSCLRYYEIVWNLNQSNSSTINGYFDKYNNCTAAINSFHVSSSVDENQTLEITADIQSAISEEPVAPWGEPDELDIVRDFLSAQTDIVLTVKNNIGDIVHTETKQEYILRDNSKIMNFSWTPNFSQAGNYTINLTTRVPDCKCGNFREQAEIKILTVNDVCIDSDNDGVCDDNDDCIGENQSNLPANETCINYILNASGCHSIIYIPDGTVINQTDCDQLDDDCVDYHDVDNICDGLGNFVIGTCNDFTNDDGSTICNSSYGTDYECPFGTALGDDVYKQTIVQYCGVNTGDCNGDLGYQSDWTLQDNCTIYEYCLDNQPSCQACPDADSDGVCDAYDNCINIPNPAQEDADNDGVGDVCDIECNDGLDNDGDGAIDFPNDFSCSDAQDDDEANPLSECQNSLDDDGDGLTDLNDPGCSDNQDNDESDATSQCQDGIDNDGDGATDFLNDFSCSSPQDNDETNPKSQCQDGIDNDGDGLADLNDPGCSDNQDNDEYNNWAPIITSAPVTSFTPSNENYRIEYIYDVNAIDPNGDPVTYSLIRAPSGMTIDSISGLIKWIPKEPGDYLVEVKASDGTLFDTQAYTLNIKRPRKDIIPRKKFFISKIRTNQLVYDEIKAGDLLFVDLTFENIGRRNTRYATIRITAPELGISRRLGPFTGPEIDEVMSKGTYLEIPKDAKPGVYTVRISLSDLSGIRRTRHRDFRIIE